MRLIQVLSCVVAIFLVGSHSPVVVSGRTVKKRSNDDDSLINPVSSQLQASIGKRRVKRAERPIDPPLLEYYFNTYNMSVPKERSPYGQCSVSLGYDKNEGCLKGEVCVDPETLKKVACPLTEFSCPDCPAPPPPPPPGPTAPYQPVPPARRKRSGNLRLRRQIGGGTGTGTGTGNGAAVVECPRGCKPGQYCSAGPPDGICQDGSFPAEDYVEKDEEMMHDQTPMVLFSGTAKHGDKCIVYGDRIDILQRGSVDFAEKSKILRTSEVVGYFGGEICNWASAHTECIPEEPRVPVTTEANKIYTRADIDARKRVAGTCKCMLALGEYAVAMHDEDKGYIICYIPANKGIHSECGQEISIPYGEIESIRRDDGPIIRNTEPAAKFCVPNAECRSGYEYNGFRCQCKPNAKWNPFKFTCAIATRSGVPNALFIFILFFFSFSKVV